MSCTSDPEDEFTTYRRADGRLIWGEYTFLTDFDGLEVEKCGIIEEVWQLKSRTFIPYVASFDDDEFDYGDE